MAYIQLKEFNKYDFSKEELIDAIGENFRLLAWWMKGNIGADNVSPQYITQQISETIQVDSGVEDAIKAIVEAMGAIGGGGSGDDYIECGSGVFGPYLDFTYTNSYTVKPVVTTNCQADIGHITAGSGETLVYTGVRITPKITIGDYTPTEIHMMAACSGKFTEESGG